MIRRLIKPAYSHAPWKNPTHPPVYKGKRSPSKVLGAKVLGGEVTTTNKAEKGVALKFGSELTYPNVFSFEYSRYKNPSGFLLFS